MSDVFTLDRLSMDGRYNALLGYMALPCFKHCIPPFAEPCPHRAVIVILIFSIIGLREHTLPVLGPSGVFVGLSYSILSILGVNNHWCLESVLGRVRPARFSLAESLSVFTRMVLPFVCSTWDGACCLDPARNCSERKRRNGLTPKKLPLGM